MIDELGENKIAVNSFNQEVGSTLEDLSKTMNSKYSLTNDYHAKVRKSMDGLEKQVYKVVNYSKNFVPPQLPGGARIISALKGEVKEQEKQDEANNPTATLDYSEQNDNSVMHGKTISNGGQTPVYSANTRIS